jgi:hypothetical protein
LAILASKPAPEVSLAKLSDKALTRDQFASGLVKVAETDHSPQGWVAIGLVGAALASPLALPVLNVIGTWSGVGR